MNKILIVSLLTILFLPALSVLASSGTAAIPIWQDCRGAHPHGNIEVGASVGQSGVVVSWTSPGSDWEKDLKCEPLTFESSTVDVYAVHPGVNYSPSTVVCHSTSCSDGFTLLYTVCVGKYGCTQHIYDLVYGDSVVVNVCTDYGGFSNHCGSYTLIVRD